MILSKKNTVRVVLNLQGNYESTLNKLEKRLDKLSQKRITPNLEIRANDEVAETSKKLDTLSKKRITPNLNIRGTGEILKTKALVKSLGGRETVHLRIKESRQRSLRKSGLKAREKVRASQKKARRQKGYKREHRNALRRKTMPGRRPFGGQLGTDFDQMSRRLNERKQTRNRIARASRTAQNVKQKTQVRKSPLTRISKERQKRLISTHPTRTKAVRRRQRLSRMRNRRRSSPVLGRIANLFDAPAGAGGGGGGGGRGIGKDAGMRGGGGRNRRRRGFLGRVIPTGKFSRQASSMIMVALMSISQAVGGILAAWAGHLTAMAGIVGLGALGFGETAAQAQHLAKVRTRIFGRELFEEFRPATTHFAPFTDNLFQTLPARLGKLTDVFRDLDVFIPSIDPAIDGTIDWVERALRVIIDLNDEIVELSMRFGSLLGSGLIDLFRWFVEGAHDTQDEFIRLAAMFVDIIKLVFRLAFIWGQVMTVLHPVFKLLAKVADILDNRLMVGILQVVLVLAILNKGFVKMITLLTAFKALSGAGIFAKMATGISLLIGKYMTLTKAIMSTFKAKLLLLGLTGVGLALGIGGAIAAAGAVGSFGPSTGNAGNISPGGATPTGASGGGSGNVIHHYSMSVEGDAGRGSMNKFKDMAGKEAKKQIEIDDKQNKP